MDVEQVRARQRAPKGGTAAVLAHVDRTTADLAVASLLAYGIEAQAVTDPAAGNARHRAPRSAAVHGVVVRRAEHALARDVLRRSTDGLPSEFRDDDIEAWSARRIAEHDRGTTRMVLVGGVVAVLFVVAVFLVAAGIALAT